MCFSREQSGKGMVNLGGNGMFRLGGNGIFGRPGIHILIVIVPHGVVIGVDMYDIIPDHRKQSVRRELRRQFHRLAGQLRLHLMQL